MSREVHVRFCEGLEGKFLWPTQQDNLIPVLSIVLIVGILILFLYKWMNQNALANPELYNVAGSNPQKQRKNLNLTDSFKMIFTSRYLGLVFVIMFCYNLSLSLVEGIWKSKIKELYSDIEGYLSFSEIFMWYQSFLFIVLGIIGVNIMRRVSWFTAAIFTPVMILSTGGAFFLFVLFAPTAFWGISSLVIIVIIGSAQNILSKAAHASLFTPTKEMLYIPLDDEMKAKARAVIGVLGSGLASGAGAFIQSMFFIMMPSYSFTDASPFFAVIFFVTVILWIFAVRSLRYKIQS